MGAKSALARSLMHRLIGSIIVSTNEEPSNYGLAVEFGKRDVRKSEEVQSLPVRPPAGSPAERIAREIVPDKSTKSITLGVMLPVIAGGILLALWLAQHVVG